MMDVNVLWQIKAVIQVESVIVFLLITWIHWTLQQNPKVLSLQYELGQMI